MVQSHQQSAATFGATSGKKTYYSQ